MKNELYILNVEYLYDDIKFREKFNLLEKEKQENVMKNANLNDRVRALGKYLLLKRVFELHEIENHDIGYEEYGKPYMIHEDEFFYNISHSGEYVVCAVGNTPIGVDIQEWKAVKENVAKRFFSKEEIKQLNCCKPEQWESLFYRYWTAKESYIKFTGLGMKQRLDSFQVEFDKQSIVDDNHQEKIHIKEYFCLENYSITACSNSREFAKFVRKIFYRL
ncbi:MAG: 4'-phosphopantetheinyl transferase superfamily protein [Eubacteriales bacterium]